MSTPLEDQLSPLKLLGGLTAADLWPANNVIFLGWILLMFFPRWKHTQSLSLIPPIFHSAIYVLTLLSNFIFSDDQEGPPDFATFQGVVDLFQNPNNVYVGWVHYLAFDLLVGRMIVADSVKRGASMTFHAGIIAPCLVLTLMFGPTGWLLYTVSSTVFLTDTEAGKGKKE